MSVITISLPDDVREWVEQEAAIHQIGDDEFLIQLARRAKQDAHFGRADDEKELEKLLLEAVNSNEPAQPVDTHWWNTVRAEVDARLNKEAPLSEGALVSAESRDELRFLAPLP